MMSTQRSLLCLQPTSCLCPDPDFEPPSGLRLVGNELDRELLPRLEGGAGVDVASAAPGEGVVVAALQAGVEEGVVPGVFQLKCLKPVYGLHAGKTTRCMGNPCAMTLGFFCCYMH